jgi:hypothetical protein
MALQCRNATRQHLTKFSSSWKSSLINDGIGFVGVRPDGAIVASGANTYVLNNQGTVRLTLTNQSALAVFSDSSILTSNGITVSKISAYEGINLW